jgi:hypothetical protein
MSARQARDVDIKLQVPRLFGAAILNLERSNYEQNMPTQKPSVF